MNAIEIRAAGKKLACDWGVFNNPDIDPALPIEPLIITQAGWVQRLLNEGPIDDPFGNPCWARADSGSTFVYAIVQGTTYCWKLQPAYWWDYLQFEDNQCVDCALLVGRWVD